jgi:hypothetical protein
MAHRRMFSQDIVSSDAFLDMPISSQVLYFHLAIRADDDGFVTPKMVMRLIGSGNDDLKVLISKRFLLPFESGVVVIKHWLIHNLIRADMYKETLYKKEKLSLGLNENGAYTELRDGVDEIKQIEAPEWLKRRRKEVCTVNVPKTALRLGKDRLGKDSKHMSLFEDFWNLYPKKTSKKLCESLWSKKNLDKDFDDIKPFIEKAKETDRWKKGFVKNPETFIRQECWKDDLTAYGKANTNDVYKNKGTSTAEKLQAKLKQQ